MFLRDGWLGVSEGAGWHWEGVPRETISEVLWDQVPKPSCFAGCFWDTDTGDQGEFVPAGWPFTAGAGRQLLRGLEGSEQMGLCVAFSGVTQG